MKSPMSMVGYLNDVSGQMVDGWLDTGDMVEVDGEWMKILGRESDIVNVGGQKVYPCEVESVLLEIENISDVSVYGTPNPIMGHVVAARINLFEDEPVEAVKKRIRRYCKDRLETFKIPASVEVTEEKLEMLHTEYGKVIGERDQLSTEKSDLQKQFDDMKVAKEKLDGGANFIELAKKMTGLEEENLKIENITRGGFDSGLGTKIFEANEGEYTDIISRNGEFFIINVYDVSPEKQMAFKRVMMLETIALGFASLVAIIAAFYGLGVHSLILMFSGSSI